MHDLVAKIQLEKQIQVSAGQSSEYGNTRAKSLESVVDNTAVNSISYFMVGVSDVSQGINLVYNIEKVPFYSGTEVAVQGGGFTQTPYVALLSDKLFSTIRIVFDSVNNRYPSIVNIDNTIYAVSSSAMSLTVPLAKIHTIYFPNYAPGYPLHIEKISVTNEIEIPPRAITSVNFSNEDRSSIDSVCWGIHSNSGTLECRGYTDVLKDIVSQNNTIRIYLRNSYVDTLIATFVIQNIDIGLYNYDTIKIEFSDNLEKWQYINIPNDLVVKMYSAKAEDVIKYAATNLINGQDIPIGWDNSGWSTAITIYAPIVEKSSWWAFITKICELAGSYLSCDEKGRAIITYGGGS